MLHNETRKLLLEALNKTHNATGGLLLDYL